MYVAIEGCSHGELDVIYSTILHAQKKADLKLDLLICCGDFQSVRNPTDLKCMAVPTKYMHMQSFYKYYSGEKIAPVLTIFIGGNHEASNFLQELPYGGWVAPNIYYLGYGGVVNVGGLRIGGISGIYKGHDYLKGRFERPPYSDSTIRSVYHVRNLEVFRMKQLAQGTPLDIFLSHDWPRGVTKYGDADKLCQQKKFFKEEVESDSLGSRAAQELLYALKPKYWFAGHLHVKFAALVGHEADPETEANSEATNKLEETNGKANTKQKEVAKDIVRFTRFLALDKCLPRREFLQILDIKCGQKHPYQNVLVSLTPSSKKDDMIIPIKDQCLYNIFDSSGNIQLYHDLEWLTVLRLTDHLQKVTPHSVYMPGPGGSEPYQFTPSEADLRETLRLMNNDLCIKRDLFTHTAPAFDPVADAFAIQNIETVRQPEPVLNPYTDDLCNKLEISEPIALMMKQSKHPHKRMSVMVTPKRQPTAAEMDVTLDVSSRDDAPGSDDETSCVSSGDTGGDIIFEVSISSDSDGTSKGMLSPAITPIRSKLTFGARKALLLSTPQHSSVVRSPTSSSSPLLPDSPLVKPLTGPHHSNSSFTSDSPPSILSNESSTPGSPIIASSSEGSCVQQVEDLSQKSLSSTSPSLSSSPAGDDAEELEQPNAEGRSSRVLMKLSRPINEIEREENYVIASGKEDQLLTSVALLPADMAPLKPSQLSTEASLNGNTQLAGTTSAVTKSRTTPSPKRLLEDNCDGEVQGCQPKPSEDSSVVSKAPTASVAPKPSKIRRRNAAVYTAPSED